jgi:hypothetical protein
LHVDGSLEHEEYVGAIVCVDFFTIRTKVLGAEGAAVPFSGNAHHVPVTKGEGMYKVVKIGWYDPGKQVLLSMSDGISVPSITYLQDHPISLRQVYPERGQQDFDICERRIR